MICRPSWLRPPGSRRIWSSASDDFRDRLEGARGWGAAPAVPWVRSSKAGAVERMEEWAAYLGDQFPLSRLLEPSGTTARSQICRRARAKTSRRSKMDGVPTDDDLNYTLLGLMILEEYGPDFNIDDMGEAWVKYLPFAFTAEGIALENLRKGVPALEAGALNNPCLNWIGADIRSDPWGYAAPGWPEKRPN